MTKEYKIKDIIEILYNSEENNLDEVIKNANKNISNIQNEIPLDKLYQNENIKSEQVKEIIEKLEENYCIKIAEYNKEIYKKGFIDGVNLMLECLENN